MGDANASIPSPGALACCSSAPLAQPSREGAAGPGSHRACLRDEAGSFAYPAPTRLQGNLTAEEGRHLVSSSSEPRPVREGLPAPGQLVRVRARSFLVEEVVPPARPSEQTLVRLSCLDDDAQGEELAVLWEREVDAAVSAGSGLTKAVERAPITARILQAPGRKPGFRGKGWTAEPRQPTRSTYPPPWVGTSSKHPAQFAGLASVSSMNCCRHSGLRLSPGWKQTERRTNRPRPVEPAPKGHGETRLCLEKPGSYAANTQPDREVVLPEGRPSFSGHGGLLESLTNLQKEIG